jgi:hypothetical protein
MIGAVEIDVAQHTTFVENHHPFELNHQPKAGG